MEASRLEKMVSDTERSIHDKMGTVTQKLQMEEDYAEVKPRIGLQPTEALKRFFDCIPLFSVPGIDNDAVVEVKADDTMCDALKHLYKQNVLGAPVRDPQQSDKGPLSDQYVGLLDFASMVLWTLEEFEDTEVQAKVSGMVVSPIDAPAAKDLDNRTAEQVGGGPESTSQAAQNESHGFFQLLDKIDSVQSTKVGALARSFRWGPFLPVRPEDSLLHVLLLLSKHRLKAVPVVDTGSSDPRVKGFITQDVAVKLLLQCDGLIWFDMIAEKPLQEFRFQVDDAAGQLASVYGDDTLLTALRAMWKHRISGVPVLDRATGYIVGNIRNQDLHILLDQPQFFSQRRVLHAMEFMQADSSKNEPLPTASQSSLEQDFGAAISAAALTLGAVSTPRMLDPVTSKASDTLKMTMQKLAQAHSDRSFLVDDEGKVMGVITLRDIIMQFAPPLAEVPNSWGGFFESALQQTNAFMEPGCVVVADQG